MSAGEAVTTAIAELENNDDVAEVGAKGSAEHGHWIFACVEVGGGGGIQDRMEELGFLAHVSPEPAGPVLEDYSDEGRIREADERAPMLSFEYGASYGDYPDVY